jgi:hypothetical protein
MLRPPPPPGHREFFMFNESRRDPDPTEGENAADGVIALDTLQYETSKSHSSQCQIPPI